MGHWLGLLRGDIRRWGMGRGRSRLTQVDAVPGDRDRTWSENLDENPRDSSSVDAQQGGSGFTEIEFAPFCEGATVVDGDDDADAVARIRDAEAGSEPERAMGSGEGGGIEERAGRGGPAGVVFAVPGREDGPRRPSPQVQIPQGYAMNEHEPMTISRLEGARVRGNYRERQRENEGDLHGSSPDPIVWSRAWSASYCAMIEQRRALVRDVSGGQSERM